jgi:transposase
MIIAFLGESIKDYRESFLLYLGCLELHCPYCSSSTHWHCWYNRFIKGEELPIAILRVKCCGCRKTHAVLPDFLSPYKHYPQEVQESVLEQVLEEGVAVEHVSITPTEEESSASWPSIDTMRLWIRRHRKRERLYIGAIAGFLERHRVPVGVWKQGFACFSHLIHLAEQLVQQAIRSSCLLGNWNRF